MKIMDSLADIICVTIFVLLLLSAGYKMKKENPDVVQLMEVCTKVLQEPAKCAEYYRQLQKELKNE